MYIWELPDWPHFRWNAELLLNPLATARLKQGRLLGRMGRLGFDLQLEAEVQAITEEALKSSEIEGEILNRETVRSSVARRLGVPDAAIAPEDRRVEGIVELTLDATRNFAIPLTRERLFAWQAALFPTGFSGLRRVKTGGWREDNQGPMQVVSGGIGREKVHFEAPPAARVEAEMQAFLTWFNQPQTIDGVMQAAIAHLWFVTIHPFDDGNGRIARALADMCLARSENSSQRFYSLASQIRRERPEYYASLEHTQKGDLDITGRVAWFIECFSRAIDAAELVCAGVLRKADFWQRHALVPLNERQRKVLNRYLDGFEGKLTTPKWAKIAKCSVPTAQRDIKDLVDRHLLVRNEGGSKNTSYSVASSRPADPTPGLSMA
ncbi:MAG: Fic family protein [Alphaproteobacteria bacterium]